MTAPPLAVLIVGGYGTFGSRLAELLAGEGALTLMIAGRSYARAQALCARLAARAGAATLAPVAFDRGGDVGSELARIRPGLVVDASGPFQIYGGDPYALARAAIELGIDYLDLADDADFVSGIGCLDALASARGVFALSGVSTFPVLTAAAVRRLAKPMARVETITAGLAPSPFARVGLNVIRATASYAGKPVALLRDGRKATGTALVDTRRYTIGPPGRLPLRPTRFSLIEVPDLKLMAELWPSLRAIWIGAGPVPEIFHRALNLLARTVKAGLIPTLAGAAPLMHWASNRLVWGEHRSGMFVAVEGVDHGGDRIARAWEVIAEGDDGPFIPSMPAAALIRRVLAGRRPAAGARPAVAELELDDYEVMFAPRAIRSGEWQTRPADPHAPLYRRLLGAAFDALPAPLKAMHAVTDERHAEGMAVVDRGRGALARLVAYLLGFPPGGRDVPVRVSFTVRHGRETWRRIFGEHAFATEQAQGTGACERLLCERFGPFTFAFALVLEDERLHLVMRRCMLLGLGLPRALAPRIKACEYAAEGRFNFHVEIAHPVFGLILRYQGWLVPGQTATSARASP